MEALKGMDTAVTAESEDSQQQHQGRPDYSAQKKQGKKGYRREERQFSGVEMSSNLKERISSGRLIKS